MEEKYLDNGKLSLDFISEYNIDECITISKLLMKKYNRLINSCSEEPILKITSNYEPRYFEQTNMRNTKMNIIDKHLDDLKDYDYMKQKITNIMNVMSYEERVCFVEMFVNGTAVYTISKIIRRNKDTVKKIMNSCAIRTAIAFHLEVMKNETRNIDETKEIELVYY